MKIVVVSGGFDPIHSGHIEYFKSAKNNGDRLIVALNSDKWLENKKGKFFMPFSERLAIVSSIHYVDEVMDFDDDSKGSCINALEKVKNNIRMMRFFLPMVAIEIIVTFQRCRLMELNFYFL